MEYYTGLTREFLTCVALCHELLVEEKTEKDGSVTKSYQGSSPDEIAICKGAKQSGVEFMGNSFGVSKVDFLGEMQAWEVLIVSDHILAYFNLPRPSASTAHASARASSCAEMEFTSS
jgi:magnesium-transporting ATPase (P-type)